MSLPALRAVPAGRDAVHDRATVYVQARSGDANPSNDAITNEDTNMDLILHVFFDPYTCHFPDCERHTLFHDHTYHPDADAVPLADSGPEPHDDPRVVLATDAAMPAGRLEGPVGVSDAGDGSGRDAGAEVKK